MYHIPLEYSTQYNMGQKIPTTEEVAKISKQVIEDITPIIDELILLNIRLNSSFRLPTELCLTQQKIIGDSISFHISAVKKIIAKSTQNPSIQ